jgi:hypothetical protein
VQQQTPYARLGELPLSPAVPGTLVVIVVPTYVGRCSSESLWTTIERIGASAALAEREHPEYSFLFALAMQWENPDTESACIARLAEIERKWTQAFGCPYVGLAIAHKSKLLALNASIPLLDASGAAVVCWVDDDIMLDMRCLTELLGAFDPTFEGVYGARKITVADQTRFSAIWARHKNRIEPVNLYPHGCCMLISRREFHVGIPPAYRTDDHYYLLRYLDAEQPRPLAALKVVPQALLYCPTADRPRTMLGRIRRNYSNVLRVLADAPDSTIRYFLRQLMFQNLRLPQGYAELRPAYMNALLWHALKFLFWLSCAIPVLVRGTLNRPTSPKWYAAPFPSALGRDHGDG